LLFVIRTAAYYSVGSWGLSHCLVSDLFKLNQLSALHLLLHGEEQLPQYPGFKLIYFLFKFWSQFFLGIVASRSTGPTFEIVFIWLIYHRTAL
jgi:hypothetical protein